MPRTLKNCHNFTDLKDLAKRRLPGPLYHYIDGAAEDETTYRRNTEAYEQCDLIPNVLAGVENIDIEVMKSVNVKGTSTMCSAALASHVERFIYFSSIHAYEQKPLDRPLNEDRMLVTDSKAPQYDQSKARAELEVNLSLIHI